MSRVPFSSQSSSVEGLLAKLNDIGQLVVAEDGTSATYEASPDCVEALGDLLRLLRRDAADPAGPVRQRLADLDYVRTDLAPLLAQAAGDAALARAVLRVLVLLVVPPDERRTLPAARGALVRALQQHRSALARADVVAALVAVLAGPLQRLQVGGAGEAASIADADMVGLVLALLRHVLLVPSGAAAAGGDSGSGGGGSSGAADDTAEDTLIAAFADEKLLELLLVAVQLADEHAEWSVMLLDIVYLLYRKQTPDGLWDDDVLERLAQQDKEQRQAQQQQEQEQQQQPVNKESDFVDVDSILEDADRLAREPEPSSAAPSAPPSSAAAAALVAQMRKERRAAAAKRLGHHTRFARPFEVKEFARTFVVRGGLAADGTLACPVPARQQPRARSGTVVARHRLSHLAARARAPRAPLETRCVLHRYACAFVESGYAVLFATLGRLLHDAGADAPTPLLPSDRLNRLWLIAFFTTFHLRHEEHRAARDPAHAVDVAPVACSLDLGTLAEIVEHIQLYDAAPAGTAVSRTALATAVLALTAVLRVLRALAARTGDTPAAADARALAVSIATRLFHDPETVLNRIPALIAKYNPRTRPVEELEALIQCGDVLLDLVHLVALQLGETLLVRTRRGATVTASVTSPPPAQSGGGGDEQAVAQPEKQQEAPSSNSGGSSAAVVAEQQEQQEQLKPPETQDAAESLFGDGAEEKQDEEEEEEEEGGGFFSSDEDEAGEVFESQLKYATHLSMYCTNSMISTYALLLSRVDVLARAPYAALLGVLERILADVPGSVGFFWQLPLFAVFERVLATDVGARPPLRACALRLRALVVRILSDFFAAARRDPTLFVRVFAWRTRGANRALTGARTARSAADAPVVAAVLDTLDMAHTAQREQYEADAAATELTVDQIQQLVEHRPRPVDEGEGDDDAAHSTDHQPRKKRLRLVSEDSDSSDSNSDSDSSMDELSRILRSTSDDDDADDADDDNAN